MAKDTRARMLETAARLLRHRGYHGMAVSDVLEESGAPRGSLYFHFPGGKDQLVIEATRAAIDEATAALRHALHGAKTPARGVRAFVEEAAKILKETNYTFGCPVSPVILDASGGLAELEEMCRRAFEEWVGILQSAFVGAGVPRRRARTLALLVESSMEGLLLMGRAYRDSEVLTIVAVELETIIAAACGSARRSA
jgi:TetR/AcrR family transcriptional regulator, lmrAB and yxaGH operons repressor